MFPSLLLPLISFPEVIFWRDSSCCIFVRIFGFDSVYSVKKLIGSLKEVLKLVIKARVSILRKDSFMTGVYLKLRIDFEVFDKLT